LGRGESFLTDAATGRPKPLIQLSETKNERNKMSNTKSNGKVEFITGGNRGLGLETARELGKQGIVVVLGSRDPKKDEAAAAQLRDEGITAESLGFDVNKSQDHQEAYDYFAKKYGRLDILVNNAGVL